jgi:DNA primase
MATSNNFLVYGGDRGRPGAIDFASARAVPISTVIGATIPLKRAGRDLAACCPFHPDRSPSFTVNDEKGFYHCFGCGAHGDAVDFVMALHRVDAREAVVMITGGSVSLVEQRPVPAPAEPERETSGEAIAIWQASTPAAGTLAEAYLRHRGIDIALPDTIRFAELRYGHRGPLYPVLVALITDVGDLPIGIQRTYLAPNGLGKADVPKAKLSLGRITGGAIRLAPPTGELIVCEGLEDGLSLLQQAGRATWVAAGATNLAAIQLPPVVRAVVIGSDNDPAGQLAATKAAKAFTDGGRPVRIIRPAAGFKDFNAELQGDR